MAGEELLVKIIGDASKLKSELDKSGRHVGDFGVKVSKMGKTVALAGVAITAAFAAVVLKTAAVGDQFDKMSLRTGIAVEDLSSLAYAADISGTDIGTLEKGLKALTKVMDDASEGIGEGYDAFLKLDIAVVSVEGSLKLTNDVIKQTAIEIDNMGEPTETATLALDKLGISVVDIEGDLRPTVDILKEAAEKITNIKDPSDAAALAFDIFGESAVGTEEKLRPTVDVLKEAATKISEIEDPTKQAALAMDLFGARAGPALLPLLKMGEAGIEELMAKAKELGITMTTEAATAAAEFTDRMTDLKGSLAGAGRMIGDTLIPALTPLIEKATEIVVKIKDWAEENSELVEKIFKWAAGLGVVLAVLGPILVLLPSLIAGVTLLAGSFLPFAIGGAIILGIMKLSEYLGDVKEKAFELNTGFKEWKLDELTAGIAEFEKTIAGLEDELEEVAKPFKIFGLEIENQDPNIGRLRQSIKDWKIQLGWLKEQKEKLIKTGKEEIDVAKIKAEMDEATKGMLVTLAQEEERLRKEIEKATAAEVLANAQKEIGNKLYGLTHTAMEVAVRDLDLLKDSYEKKGIAQGIVDEWYGKEILRLKELYKEQKEHISTMEEVASVTNAVEDAIYDLTHEPYEVVIKKINEKYDDYIKVIEESTLSTSEQETAIHDINLVRDKEIEGVDTLTEAEKENIKQKKLLTDAYDAIKEDILELTSTPMETMIRKLEEEADRMEDLGVEIELVNEWLRLQIEALSDTGDAFTEWGEIAWTALKKVTDYLVDNLTPAIEDFFFGIEGYETDWEDFWKGLWNVLKTYISNIIVKLLIAIPLLLIWNVLTGGGLTWVNFWKLWGDLGFEKGGGVGYDKGGQVKEFQAGGVADTIPARLTIGEYVIAKPMTDFIRRFRAFPANLITAISAGLPTPVPAFAGGGLVGSPNITTTGYGDTKIYIDIHGNYIADDVDIKSIATKVSDEMLRKLNLRRRF